MQGCLRAAGLRREPDQDACHQRPEDVGVEGSRLRIWGPIAALVAVQVVVAAMSLVYVRHVLFASSIAWIVTAMAFSQGRGAPFR